MNIYQHIAFNPHFETITQVINSLGANPIWSLSHIVPITEYEWVAIFKGWDSQGDDQAVLGKNPITENKLTQEEIK